MMKSPFAFVFPGQGSQSLGMLQGMMASHGSLVTTWNDKASKILGYDLLQCINQGPEAELNRTEITQPALLFTSYTIWQAWLQQQGPKPRFMAGHSLGEYTALVCAEALSFEDAIQLVALRGRLMQQAVPSGKGAMAAIVGLANESVQALCKQAKDTGIVVAANFNAIGQVVISGETAAVEHVVGLAKEEGAKLAKVLPVSVPSHSPLMKPAAEELAIALNAIPLQKPKISVLHNVSVTTCEHPDDIRQKLVEQLYQPVRWVETIQLLAQEQFNPIIECGPGKVLTGLSKRIDKTRQGIAMHDAAAIEQALQQIVNE